MADILPQYKSHIYKSAMVASAVTGCYLKGYELEGDSINLHYSRPK